MNNKEYTNLGIKAYRLVDGEAVLCKSLEEQTKAFMWCCRRVNATTLDNGALVSTVFLCIDHNTGFEGPPLLFETAVFKPDEDCDIVERYATLKEAQAGHKRTVENLKLLNDA